MEGVSIELDGGRNPPLSLLLSFTLPLFFPLLSILPATHH